MARNKQIARIYNLLIILEYAPHGLTVRSLCNRLNARGHEVGVRTVYRDLLALQAAGFPLAEHGTDADNATRWILARRSKITEVAQMTTAEVRVLAQVLDTVVKGSDGPSKVDARSLVRKIVGQLNIPKDSLPQSLM
jgi:predicted DNA-binding transcriptional regulator YafY